MTKAEVERYREELVSHYGQWRVSEYPNTLLSFLASTIDMRAMAEGAIRLAKQIVFHGEALAHQILTTDNIDYCDSDLYEPYLAVLEHYAAWGWLIFTYEERAIPDDMPRVYIEVKRKPICDEVASMIEKIRSDHQAGSAPSGATFETT